MNLNRDLLAVWAEVTSGKPELLPDPRWILLLDHIQDGVGAMPRASNEKKALELQGKLLDWPQFDLDEGRDPDHAA